MRWLGMLWASPWVLVLWGAYLLPLWALRWVRLRGLVAPGIVEFEVVAQGNWYARAWKRWGGFAGPGFVLTRGRRPELLAHEVRHVHQWWILGILFPVVYGLLLLIFGYRNHPLEHDAKAAAQKAVR